MAYCRLRAPSGHLDRQPCLQEAHSLAGEMQQTHTVTPEGGRCPVSCRAGKGYYFAGEAAKGLSGEMLGH